MIKRIKNGVEVAPYWNVNNVITLPSSILSFVEVAPYWNVNNIKNLKHIVQINVEVAPYWNVNKAFITPLDKLHSQKQHHIGM